MTDTGATHDMTMIRGRILLPLGIDFAALAAICLLYSNNAALTAVIAAIFLFTLLFRYSRFKLFLSVFAALVGAVGEIVCCAPGVGLWTYANPSFLNIPIWLPIVWPIAVMTFVEISGCVHELVEAGGRGPAVSIVGAAIIPEYALAMFFLINWKIATILCVITAITSVFAHKPFNVVFFWTSALGGTIGEFFCVRYGVWEYTRPFFNGIGIPVSLPFTWGVAANIIWLMATVTQRKR